MISHPELAWIVVRVGVRGRFPPLELPADHIAFQVGCQFMAAVTVDVTELRQDSLSVYFRLKQDIWKAHEVCTLPGALPA